MNQNIDDLSLEEILRSNRKSIICQNKNKFNTNFERIQKKTLTKLAPRTKNSPLEVSSRRESLPKKTLNEINYIRNKRIKDDKSADPRFKDTSGNLNIHLFQRSYEFLDNMREKEIKEIKKNLKLYKLMERSKKAGTWHKIKKRSEFRNSNIVHMTNEDYENLSKQLQKYVSEIDRRNTIRVKQEVISQYRKEENKRIQEGKKPYFLKKKDINILAYKYKYDNLDKKRKRNLEGKQGLKQKIKFKPPVKR
ncbi:hypothetical protein ACR3K2_33850 [Cryptosporidium serpentis]